MNVNARRFELPDPKLRALCLAIAIALALPAAALAQDAQEAAQTATQAASEDEAQAEEADSSTEGELFAIEDSDEPELLRELTQIHNEVEFGVYWVSDDSYKFGRYTGLNEEGVYLLLDFDVYERGAWDDASARYWRFTGENLGLDSRSAGFEYGVQGKYKVYVDYDQIPNYYSDSASTIFEGAGSTSPDLALRLGRQWNHAGNDPVVAQPPLDRPQDGTASHGTGLQRDSEFELGLQPQLPARDQGRNQVHRPGDWQQRRQSARGACA